MPSNLRKNIGLHPLDAYRLVKNYDGKSPSGLHYKTDQLGFRVGREKLQGRSETWLLGGDSRIFGYALAYDATIPHFWQSSMEQLEVRMQAFPGGSPMMFNVQIWEEGLWESISPKPTRIIYAYDRQDLFNDRDFLSEYQRSQNWLYPRRLKVLLGGYLWNMMNVKKKSFTSRFDPKPKWWDDMVSEPMEDEVVLEQKSTPPAKVNKVKKLSRSNPIAKSSLLEMKKWCMKENVQFSVLYLPRMLELMFDDPKMNEELKAFCLESGIDYLDIYGPLVAKANGDGSKVVEWFLDYREGIHFSKEGNRLIAELVLDLMNIDEPLRLKTSEHQDSNKGIFRTHKESF
jgi:hypothetical protein